MSSRRGFKRERERGVELAGNATVADAFITSLSSLSSIVVVVLFVWFRYKILREKSTRSFRVLGRFASTRRERERRAFIKESVCRVTSASYVRVFLCYVLCSSSFFLITRIYILNIILNILKTPFFLISSQRLFSLLRRQLQKRQRVQLDASTVVGQLGAEFTHRNSRVSFQIVQLFLQFQVR